MFFRTEVSMSIGEIPKDYFLYYEDQAFSLELRKLGYQIVVVGSVELFHHESPSTGRRSPLMEFYNRRNRWCFIRKYFPGHLDRQRTRILYTLQKDLFRGRLDRI